MIFESIVVGPFMVNAYILGDENLGKAVIIDPGDEPHKIEQLLKNMKLLPGHIILTHAHVDHVGGLAYLKNKYNPVFMLHRDEEIMLRGLKIQGAMFGISVGDIPGVDRFLAEGDEVTLGEIRLNVLHTPGHSPGGISLVCGSRIFTGDTLFAGSIGRTDLPGGSYSTLISSIKTKLLKYPDDTEVLPGHGPQSTIGYEKIYNPFLH